LRRGEQAANGNSSDSPDRLVSDLAAWLSEQAKQLAGRAAPEHRPYLEQRMLQIASANNHLRGL
jgi:hypothetical protein